MDMYSCPEFDKFISFWSNLIIFLTIKRSFLSHVAGALIQVFAAVMLQQSSTVRALNIEALSKRLKLLEKGRFDEILDEALSIQKELKRVRIAPSSGIKKNFEKLRVVKAVRAGDIRELPDPLTQTTLVSWSGMKKLKIFLV